MVQLAEGYEFEPGFALVRYVVVRKTLAANTFIGAGEKAPELAGCRG